MGVVQRPQWMRQRVHSTEATLEGGGAHARGHQHLQPRLDVGALTDRTRQVLLHQAHAFQRDALGHGMEQRRAERLQAVRQRVHAGGGGDLRRQADRQLGVENHQRRQHAHVEDDALDMRRVVGDHRGAADFRAGAGGGRHRHHRRHAGDIDPAGVVADVLEIPQRPILADHQGDGLAGIQRRAAAKGDHPVMTAGLERRHTVHHVGAGGVALDRREQPCVHACIAALAQRRVDHRQCGQAGVGAQQRRAHAELTAGLGQLADAADADAHRGRVIPVHAVLIQVHCAPHS